MSMIEKVQAAIRDNIQVALPDGCQVDYSYAAIAVLNELLTPNNYMQVAGGLKAEALMFEGDPEFTGVIFKDMGTVFRTMVQAALDEVAA